MSEEPHGATLAARLLARIARRVGASLALDETLEAVALAVVEALGFQAAVVNLLAPDEEIYVVAVAGSPEIRAALEGTHSSRAVWQSILDASTPWGELRFLNHTTSLPADTDGMNFYVPRLPVPDDDTPEAWHPHDALFAPMLDSTGALLGILSVDDPVDGRLPTPVQRAMLEAFAVQASLAIEHAREHQALQDSEILLRRMFDESPIGKALFGPDGRYVRVNRAYCEFLGYTEQDFVGRLAVDFAHPDERASTTALAQVIRGDCRRVSNVEKRYRHADGSDLWGRLSLTRLGNGDDATVLAAIEDITVARVAEAQLRHQALHDSLTSLPNRTLIFDRLEQALARARRDGTSVAVVVIDVDHFKLVNDSYGHPAGDQLLVTVAAQLQSALRDCDTAGRLGGDEFVVVCEGIDDPSEALVIAERLRKAVRVAVQIGDVTLLPSASLGCTLSGPESTSDQLVAEADAALYRAKAAGRGRYEMFDEEMRRTSLAQLELRAQLLDALADEQLRLHYQPIIDLVSGVVLGYEALLRWEHPQRGLLAPADFLPVIVDSDLDVPVTQWVLGQACSDMAQLDRRTGDRQFVSVNLSARQLSRSELAADVQAALERAGLPAKQLWLEITEEHLVDARHRPMLDRLQSLGCRVVLDDFGTGYCGLTYLQQLPVNVLKIDREFIARLGTDRVSAGITAAVANLADVLGIRVVAEGVETQQQAELLRGMGVGLAQGYFFGRPAPFVHGLPTSRPVAQLPRQGRDRAQPALETVNDSMATG
jgi:diguanylate cyclase (GGDEF)-like protein/PAS domain S-box-containing protein